MKRARTKLFSLAGAMSLAGILSMVGACGGSAAPAGSGSQGKTSMSEVLIQVAPGKELRIAVELALTEAEQARGLMFRNALEPGKGMLFVFPAPGTHKFWMKNTYIPLDMIFLGEDRRVVFVEESADPHTLTPRGPDSAVRFVVEVPGGWAKAHGIEPGTTARFVGVPGFASP